MEPRELNTRIMQAFKDAEIERLKAENARLMEWPERFGTTDVELVAAPRARGATRVGKTTTFEAWAVSTDDGESPFVHLPGAHHIPWLTPSSEECAGEVIVQRHIGLPLARMARVRVTVEVIEGSEER